MKKKRKMKKWIQTQNPRRFPGFTVVVVIFYDEILDDFQGLPLLLQNCSSKSSTISMILFRNVSLSRSKSTTRFGFFRRKVTLFIGRETKIHIFQTKIDEKNRCGQPI